MRALLVLLVLSAPLRAESDDAGRFDYYVLSLSWSPNWCALEGDTRGAAQCAHATGHGWLMHGLWPQFYRGWPEHCDTSEPPPSRAMTAGMEDIMGSSGLAWHQWRKHGTCSGLSAEAYFETARAAFRSVRRPDVLRKLKDPVRLPTDVVEAAFLKANPEWEPDMLTITCRDGHIQEARLCLSKSLDPVPCGQDVVRDCTLERAILEPVR